MERIDELRIARGPPRPSCRTTQWTGPRGDTVASSTAPAATEPWRAIEPWPGWPPLYLGRKIGLAVVLCAAPIVASDLCVLLPCAMLDLASGGISRGDAPLEPVCSVCSLELDPMQGGRA